MTYSATFPKIFFLLLLFALAPYCTEPISTTPMYADYLPKEAKPIEVYINSVHMWVEKEKVFVTGICTNNTANWHKIWLKGIPLNAAGVPIAISKHNSVILSTHSDAVAPQGRTSFMASFPLSDFAENPTTFDISIAGATLQPAGPILAIPGTSAMRMNMPALPGNPNSGGETWQMVGNLTNPLDMVAEHPRLEVLVYGKDNLLWLSTVVNPEDPAVATFFHWDGEGPLPARGARDFQLQIINRILPEGLQAQGIGRVDLLPFVAR